MDIGFAEIDRWHKERGWIGCGYHKIIRRDGTVEDGRDIDAMGAHVRGFNQTSVGICLIGTDTFTDEQFESLADLIADILEKYPSASLRGHRDFPYVKKECPGFDVQKWWSSRSQK
jgi:N-acetylmuramoyl-L-alanine amidase